MNLIEDWVRFCKGEQQFDKSYFYTLFHGDLVENEIDLVFSSFEEKVELMERYKNYRMPFQKASKSEIQYLIKLDIEEKKKFCRFIGENELVDAMSYLSYTYVDLEKFKRLLYSDLPHVSLGELIGDSLNSDLRYSPQNNAIVESFYGLTANLNLVWYLAKPLYTSRYNPDMYFEIWRRAGSYILGRKEVFVLDWKGKHPTWVY